LSFFSFFFAAPSLVFSSAALAFALLQLKHVVEQRYPKFQSVMQRDLFDVMGSLQDGSARSEGFLGRMSLKVFFDHLLFLRIFETC